MEVFIGRIPFSAGVQKLNEMFAPYGATNVRMLDGKGCAFATFGTQYDAERAINELNGVQMGGTGPGLNVKMAATKNAPPVVERTPVVPLRRPSITAPLSVAPAFVAPTPQPQLFLGRLPAKTQSREIEELLHPYGAVNVKVLEGKNCAFANFESWAMAERCIEELNGAQLREGEEQPEGLNVKFADVKGVQKGALQEPKVFIGGLAASMTQEDVQRHCEQFGAITHCKIFTKNDRSMPCAFVTFGSFTEAERCIQNLNDQEHPMAVSGKPLVVKMADMAKSARTAPVLPPMPARFEREAPRTFFTPAPSPVVTAPMVHLQQAPAMGGYDDWKNAKKDPRPTGGGVDEKLFIGGLPEEANEDFLWGMLAPFGRVAEVKILRKPGTNPCGFVSYGTLGEAETAVQALSNCRFTVKFADAKGTKRPAPAFEEPPPSVYRRMR